MTAEERVVLSSSDFDLMLRTVTKHLQGTEYDHDQSTHSQGKTSVAGEVNVQAHDPDFFRNLAASLGVESTKGVANVAMLLSPEFRTDQRQALEEMIHEGDVILSQVLTPSRLELLETLHGDDPDKFAMMAADSIMELGRISGPFESWNEDQETYERRKELADHVAEQVARDLVAAGRVNMENFENNLNAAVDRRQAKMLAQEAVASRMADVALDDVHQVARALNPNAVVVPQEGWEESTVLVAYSPYDNAYRIQELAVNDPNYDPSFVDRRRASLADEGYEEVSVGSLTDPAMRSAYDEAIRNTVARSLISQWAKTSNKTPEAAAVQRAAADEFGLDRAAEPSDVAPPSDYASALERVARAFVRAQYEATQEMFAEQLPGVTHVRLFRGGDSASRYVEGVEGLTESGGIDTYSGADVGALVRLNQNKWSDATLNLRPMASFATTPAASNLFASTYDTTFAADVPIERILSTPFTGNGASLEAEFVVLGGPIHGQRIGGKVPKIQGTPQWPVPDDLPLGATDFIMIDGQPVPIGKAVAKHLQGTEHDHDQSTHSPGQSVEGSRLGVTQTNDTTFQYEYGDFTITTDFTSAELLDDLLEGGYYSEDNPPPNLETLGEIAADQQWDQWEGNFVMRHLAAAAMGLSHPYASGGEQFGQDIVDGIVYGERPSDEGDAEQVQQLLDKYAATTHAMLQAVADETNEWSPTWEGTVRRGMVVPVNEFGEGPLFYLREGDTLDMPLSGFTPDVTLLDKFLRGGEQSREVMQPDTGSVFEERWRSVAFEMDTSQAKTLTPSGWSSMAEDPSVWVHTSYEDRAADQTDEREFGLEPSRSVPAPWEVITQGKFRVTGTRDEERRFYPLWAESGAPPETEGMRVITIQQTAVYNPRTQTYDALPGFVTLPDGQVVPIEEAE